MIARPLRNDKVDRIDIVLQFSERIIDNSAADRIEWTFFLYGNMYKFFLENLTNIKREYNNFDRRYKRTRVIYKKNAEYIKKNIENFSPTAITR